MQSLPERTTLQDLIMLDASQAAWLDQMSERGVRNQTTLTLHKVATTSWGVQIQGLQSVLHSYLGHFGWTCAAPKVQPTVNSYSTIIDKLAKAFGLRSKELWSMMSMSSCKTLTSFANMAAVSRGRLVISMLQRIGSLAWLRLQKRIKMHSRCQLVWTCFGSMRLTLSSEIPSWQLAHLLCTVAFGILRSILFSLLLTPHWVILHTQCNATHRTEAGVEADAVSYNMLFSACSKCFDLSYLMNRSFEALRLRNSCCLIIFLEGFTIQYTFNILSIYIGTIIIFF